MDNTIGHKFYVVRNKDGQFFRAKGYGGYGPSWTPNLGHSKVYSRIGPARSRVTWWFKNYPDYGQPDIIEVTVTEANMVVLDETARVGKVIARKKKQEEEREVREKQYKLKQAERELRNAKQKLKSLRS